jgi:hypothetical protein
MKAKQKSWKDMTLATAKELMQLEKQAESIDPIDFIIERVALLDNRDPAEVENQTPEKIFQQNDAWSLSKMPVAKFTPWTKIDGKEYGISPLDKITLAQMVDIEEYYKGGLEQNIDKIISILVLPVADKTILGKRTLEEYQYDDERVEEVRKLDMEFVWQNILFFWTGVETYISSFRDYLAEVAKTTTTEMQMPNLLNMMREFNQVLTGKQSPTQKETQDKT